MGKKGVSGIIVTVILVAISISLIAIIWTIIANLVNTNLNNTETSLIKINLNIIDGTVENTSDTDFSFKIDRSYDENELVKIKFLIFSKTEETEEKILTNNLLPGEGKIYSFSTNDFSILNDTGDLKKITIAPIILKDEKEKTLPVTDTQEFKF